MGSYHHRSLSDPATNRSESAGPSVKQLTHRSAVLNSIRRRPDCVAGHVRLELRNVVANYPFESSTDFQESSRILAAETIRV
jgi:hypothetical protein